MRKITFVTLLLVSVIMYATIYYLSSLKKPPVPTLALTNSGAEYNQLKNLGSKIEAEKKSDVQWLIENLKSSILTRLEEKKLIEERKNAIKKLSVEADDLYYKEKAEELLLHPPQAIAVLVLACDRVSVNRCLDQLLKYQPDPIHFPIIIGQDCGHQPTSDVIQAYRERIYYIKQPDQSDIEVPPEEKSFEKYFKIARHYGWALNKIFNFFKFNNAIIIEDDLDVSPDIFEYFLGSLSLLHADPTLWCVSAWNDNGKLDLVDKTAHDVVYRTDFFPGLGWMLTKDLWAELSVKWPPSYWDDWMRQPEQRRDRACIRPELSRTHTFGKIGASGGLFYDQYLKFIYLNDQFVPFTKKDLTFLLKDNYDEQFVRAVYETRVVTYDELKSGKIAQDGPVRISYNTKVQYQSAAKALGLMHDFKSGVPRTAYKGIVTFFYNERRVYLAPHENWKGYDLTW